VANNFVLTAGNSGVANQFDCMDTASLRNNSFFVSDALLAPPPALCATTINVSAIDNLLFGARNQWTASAALVNSFVPLSNVALASLEFIDDADFNIAYRSAFGVVLSLLVSV
jgi:hypothetical protein